jgi:FKBP-type peptidyl-prolyl cis-trans isomerase
MTVAALILFNVLCVCAAQDLPDLSAGADASYAFGVALGSDFRQAGLRFDYDALLQGFRDSLEGRELRISLEEAIPLIQAAMRDAVARQGEENRQRGLAFLAENARKPGVMATPSGLQYEVVRQGTGPAPRPFDTVSVHYEGTLLSGEVFDSSYSRNEPAEFALDEVISGWTEGIQLMSVGSTYRLFVPPSLAYGEQGYGAIIPPNSTLIFRVELLGILE